MSFLLVLLIVTILSIIVCYQMAEKRGADPVFWAVMGAIFGPLAIPVIYFMKPKGHN